MSACPHIRHRIDRDYCELTERVSGRVKVCLLVSDIACSVWRDIQREGGKTMPKALK
jgi:hypothetical protein